MHEGKRTAESHFSLNFLDIEDDGDGDALDGDDDSDNDVDYGDDDGNVHDGNSINSNSAVMVY